MINKISLTISILMLSFFIIWNPIIIPFIILALIILYILYNPEKWIISYLIFLMLENVMKVYISSGKVEVFMYFVELLTYLVCVKCIVVSLKKNKFTINKVDKALFIFVCISVLSGIINSVDFRIFILGLRWFIRYVSVYYIMKTSNFSKIDSQKFIKLIVNIGIIQIIIGFIQIVTNRKIDIFLRVNEGISNEKYAIFGTLGRYNEYAFMIVILIAILFARYQLNISKKIFLIPLASIALILSYSRQAIIGILVAITISGFIDNKQRIGRRKILIIGVILALLAVVILPYMTIELGKGTVYEGITSRFMSIFSKEFIAFDFYNKGRLYFMFSVNLLFLKTKPLLGFGMGMYGTESAVSFNQSVYEFLNIPTKFSMDVFWQSVIGQIGVIGLIFLVLIYVYMIKYAYRAYKSQDIFLKELGLTLIILIITGIVMSFFSSALNDRYFSFIIWSLFGLLCSLKSKEITNEK